MWAIALSIVSALIGIWAFYAKRYSAPTINERIDDLNNEYHDIIQHIHELRAQGDNAGADAILRRLCTRAVGVGVLFDKTQSNLFTNTIRQRLVLPTTEGQQDTKPPATGTPGTSNQ